MLYKDIKVKSLDELQKLVKDFEAELWTLNFKKSVGSLDQSHKIRAIRRDIARIKTELNAREKGAK
ncbi:50S ribosomal protein L29 [Mycoplasmopsis agalactiae]|uniref:Large ribosomal subunit protein uL29 n=1 Tax=Mycoplasmopsis agalactiae TaxID=2110 RepID=D3VR61_MYCAA|nr:50S ribosomal protein L29 [Mycoplasmopsis agalactiae]KAB6718258.1 50S ribosomal protein L29 [Mycoplasmopsis agalactiae]MCE6056533.1 50S ribosomal protein L29 [Mycoplasmopsis agalactiae]MCE6061797.1 50S ribosomal protein L29 [Mycoplasmopsis agalactiae]MCE6091007.1 50S ribosomal protein L29 [Mycoplasmopsis agalactiae]MCE6115388.1 50S ribosomal protein L29 [Mycoplasmopsis agalactiae]